MASQNTEGLSNILIADETACGTATIVVTACDGSQATGTVKGFNGTWRSCGSFEIGAGENCVGGGGFYQTATYYYPGTNMTRRVRCAAGGQYSFKCESGFDPEIICDGITMMLAIAINKELYLGRRNDLLNCWGEYWGC